MAGVPAAMLPHTITRVRPATATDAYGNETYDYGAGASRTSMAAWMQQDTRAEPTSSGRDPLEQRWLMVTNDADVRGRDRVEWTPPSGAALLFEVEGPPAPVYTPAGYHHTESTLRVVSG